MLKYISLLGVVGLFFGITSCNKKYCYTCTTERYEVVLPENNTTRLESRSIVHCDQTAESIKIIEQNGTSFTTFNRGGKIHQEHTVTKCTP